MKRINLTALILAALWIPSLLSGQTTTSENLSFQQANDRAGELYRQAINNYASTIEENWQAGVLTSNGYQMPFAHYTNGNLPDSGYPLYISLHGGGAATAEENDQQWENQKTLYGDVAGVYLVPRAPTNTWDMWHQAYMDDFLLQIITYSVARLNVDPARIYLLGYSAGGDGVYNLATRLSDRFAAAAMMAGHPGDAKIENLRNLPFAMYVGVDDTAYNRSGLVIEWLKSYQQLNAEDQGGYEYNINIYADKGHWMDGLDGESIGWLAEHRRAGNPNKVIWIQDDVLHTRKYNLEVRNPKQNFRIEQIIDRDNNTIHITTEHYREVTVWLDDFMVNLDNPVIITFNGREVFNGMVYRDERNIIKSLNNRLDPELMYWGRVSIKI